MRDVELIACRLRRVEPLCRLTNSALQQLAMCGFYEDLEKGVTCKSATNPFINRNYSFASFPLIFLLLDSVSCWWTGSILVCGFGRTTRSTLSCIGRWRHKSKFEKAFLVHLHKTSKKTLRSPFSGWWRVKSEVIKISRIATLFTNISSKSVRSLRKSF